MNSTSAIATVTVIIVLSKYQIKKHYIIALINFLLVLITLVLRLTGITEQVTEVILSIALRYLSDLSYSIFLIWSI